MQQNQLMKQDLTNELSMQTDGIMQILKSKRISDCTPREIIEKLSIIYMLIGLRPQHFPTQAEDVLILTFIKKHFGHKTIDELYLAFELAVTGQLDVKDVKVYDQFTIEYLMRIMNSYKTWLIEKAKEKHQISKPNMQELPPLTQQDKIDEINEWRAKESIDFKLIPIYLFDWMFEYGYIKMTDDEKIQFYSRAIKMREYRLRNEAEMFGGDKTTYRNFMKMKANNFQDITKDEEFQIDNIYRKIAVYEFLKK
jgi:hypothetical protein